MKTIELTQGLVAIVDDEDYLVLSKFRWFAEKHGKTYYASRDKQKGSGLVRMHRQIMGLRSKREVDHLNRNGLDNRRCNLRHCTRTQNIWNREHYKNSKSGIKGVSWYKRDKKWEVSLMVNYKKLFLGRFSSVEEATKVYNEAANKYHGEFSYQNTI